MKLFGRKPAAPPERRHVVAPGRTTAYAYHARRSVEPSVLGRKVLRDAAVQAHNAKKAAHAGLQRFGLVVLVVVCIVAVGNLLGLSSTPRVLAVDSSQKFLHPLLTYQTAANELFGASVWNRNKLTVDVSGLSTAMKRAFPELSVVSISLPLVGQQPLVYIAQADPALVLTTASGHSYVLDTTGRAIATATSGTATTLHLLQVSDLSGNKITVGQQVLASDVVTFLRTVVYQMSQKNISVSTVVLPAASSEADFYLSGQHYLGKFNTATVDALQQVGTFLAAQHYLSGRGITPGQYIDARLQGRAYYQ